MSQFTPNQQFGQQQRMPPQQQQFGGMPPPPGQPQPQQPNNNMQQHQQRGGMPPPPAMMGQPRAPSMQNNNMPPPPNNNNMPAPPAMSRGQPMGGMPPPPGQPQQQPNNMMMNPQSGGTSLNSQMNNMNLNNSSGPGMGSAPSNNMPPAPKQFGGAPFQQNQPPAAPVQQQQPRFGGPPGSSNQPPQPGFNPAAAPQQQSQMMPGGPPQPGFNPAQQNQQQQPRSSANLGPTMQPHNNMQPPNMNMPGQPNMMMQQQQPGMMSNAPQPPGMQQQQQQQPEIFQENIDHSIKVPQRILSTTSNYIPVSSNLGHTVKVPLGAIIKPLAVPKDDEEDVCVVQPGAAGIVRCKRCRTYINAFVTFLENGRRWRCNICAQLNEVPAPYFCHLDDEGRRRDRDARPELSQGVVEYIAPSEYMVRPPQPPSYFFVIDVSATSVQSGMLKSVANAIRASLDSLPGSPRTQVGFLTYDDSVHYYSLKSGLASPQMLVVADLVELFVPAPDDLLVNLQESRDVIDVFLENLPSMFEKTTSQNACLGPALKAAFTVTKHIGGKMCVFQSVLPSIGDGALAPRENVSIMGTPDEIKLLRPSGTWYKDTAVEFSRAQICVDMFLFPRAYIDVASLSELPKITAGTLHTYPGFSHDVDGARFESELTRSLTQHTAFEAVMRIRCTRGMRINNFYGNFFVRGTDLLALPNCTSDSVFAFDLVHDEQSVSSSVVTIQAALLYTSSQGERRIRVVTQAIPVSSLASEIIGSVDADAVSALLAKQALDIGIKTNLDNARNRLQQACVELVRASKEGDKPRTVSGYAASPSMHQQQQQQGSAESEKPIPENLKLLPLYTLALMKNVAFRGGTDIHPDERVASMQRLTGMDVTASKHFIYPRMFSLHNMSPSAGLPSTAAPSDDDDKVAGQDRIELPKVLNLTVERLTSNGIFLLDDGVDMSLWVGRSSDPAILNSLFGANSLEGVDMSQVKLQTSGNDFASRLNAITSALREDNSTQNIVAKVTIVREGDHGLESRFFWHMIEDSASFNGGTFSYEDFISFVNSGGQGHHPPGAGGPRGAPPGSMPPNQQMRGPPPPNMNRGPQPPNQGGMNRMPPQQQQMPPPNMPPQQQMPPQGPPMNQPMPPNMPPQGMNRGPPSMPPQQQQQQQQQQQYNQPPPPQQMQQGPPSGGMLQPPMPQRGPPSGGPPPMRGPPPPSQMNRAPPGPPPPQYR